MGKDKIINIFNCGDVLWRINRKLHYMYMEKKVFFRAKNKNTKELLLQDQVYYRIKNEYRKFIDDYTPVFTHRFEKRIWICWLQGYENAPPIVKSCINSVRQHANGFEVVILTEKNIQDYIKLPDYILKKFRQGKITRTHFSDILRVTLLCERGGIWIDSTALCTKGTIFEEIQNVPLFVYRVLDLTNRDCDSIVASSWMIATFQESSILYLTRDLLYKYWENHDYLDNYFLFHIIFSLSSQKYAEEWKKVPMFENRAPHVLMFELGDTYSERRWKQIVRMSDIHKLTRHVEFEENTGNFYSYIIDRYGNVD